MRLRREPSPIGSRPGVLGVGVQSVQKVPVTRLRKINYLASRKRRFSCENSKFLSIPLRTVEQKGLGPAPGDASQSYCSPI